MFYDMFSTVGDVFLTAFKLVFNIFFVLMF